MIRAFVAVPVPAILLDGVEEVIRELRKLRLDARFVKRESIHLTLKFLGNIDESLIEPIRRALEEELREVAEFEVAVRQIGVFPDPRRPRVVWLGLVPPGGLGVLQRHVEAGLKSVGFAPEKRPFHAHLTLARLKSVRNRSRLVEFIQGSGRDLHLGSLPVGCVNLYQSFLKPDGAVYRRLASVPLGGTEVEASGETE